MSRSYLTNNEFAINYSRGASTFSITFWCLFSQPSDLYICQVVDEKGKKTTLMSARNFYNAMTPGSSIGQEFGKGRSSYMTIEETDLGADWLVSQNKVPREGLLNEMNEKGLLTYTDFHFLFLLMSTPRRYVDMVFHAFDVSADGNVESKEFVHILAKIANVKTNPEVIFYVTFYS